IRSESAAGADEANSATIEPKIPTRTGRCGMAAPTSTSVNNFTISLPVRHRFHRLFSKAMTIEARHAAKRQADAEVGARHAAHLRALNLQRVLAFAVDQPGPFTRAEVIR